MLLKCILGLMQPDDGSIKVDGEETVDLGDHGRSQVMRKFGMLFQGGALFDSLRVWENVAFGPIQSDGMPPEQAREVAIAKLGNVGLGPEIGELFPAELSGGMQKRVALARAIAREPEIIFFDEPTTGLDPIMADVINDLIVKCVKRPRRHRGVDHPRHGERAQDRPPHRHAPRGPPDLAGPGRRHRPLGQRARGPVHPRPRRRADPDAGPETLTMPRGPSLDEVRRHFAEELRVVSHIGCERVVEAFAAVPRERFAGPGPWRLLHDGDGYWSTPDANPRWLYHNVLVALDEKRRLNIGGPSLWAFHFDRIGVRQGDRVLQIGAGSGYYTAILAELAGPRGRIDALEIDEGSG